MKSVTVTSEVRNHRPSISRGSHAVATRAWRQSPERPQTSREVVAKLKTLTTKRVILVDHKLRDDTPTTTESLCVVGSISTKTRSRTTPQPCRNAYRAPLYEVPRDKTRKLPPPTRGRRVELWLVRHGETEANAQRITQGQQPGRLTAAGARQAAKLGSRLVKDHADHPFHVVLSSDLLRCRQTAALATRGWVQDEPMFLDPTLRERSVGIFEGTPHAAPRPRRPPGVAPRLYRAPEGESWIDVYERAGTFLDRVAATYLHPAAAMETLRILVVTHGGFIAETLNAARSTRDATVGPLAVNGAVNTAVYKLDFIPAPPPSETSDDNTTTKGTLKNHRSVSHLPHGHICRILAANDASHLLALNNKKPTDFDVANDDPPLPTNLSAIPWWSDLS